MTYIYERESFKKAIILQIFLFPFLYLVVGGIMRLVCSMALDSSMIGFVVLVAITILILGIITYLNFLTWESPVYYRKFARKMITEGTKVNGTVASGRKRQHKASIAYNGRPGYRAHTYNMGYYKVVYKGLDGLTKSFNTPEFNHVPGKNCELECDVYLLNDDVYVTNFRTTAQKSNE